MKLLRAWLQMSPVVSLVNLFIAARSTTFTKNTEKALCRHARPPPPGTTHTVTNEQNTITHLPEEAALQDELDIVGRPAVELKRHEPSVWVGV